MPQFKVSSEASRDLFDIGDYTQNKYGILQRNKYLDQFVDKFQAVADDPNLGMIRTDIRDGYYSLLINKHIIFYKKYSYGARIVRVLHQSMDFSKHL